MPVLRKSHIVHYYPPTLPFIGVGMAPKLGRKQLQGVFGPGAKYSKPMVTYANVFQPESNVLN